MNQLFIYLHTNIIRNKTNKQNQTIKQTNNDNNKRSDLSTSITATEMHLHNLVNDSHMLKKTCSFLNKMNPFQMHNLNSIIFKGKKCQGTKKN